MDEFRHGALISIIASYAAVRFCVSVWKTRDWLEMPKVPELPNDAEVQLDEMT